MTLKSLDAELNRSAGMTSIKIDLIKVDPIKARGTNFTPVNFSWIKPRQIDIKTFELLKMLDLHRWQTIVNMSRPLLRIQFLNSRHEICPATRMFTADSTSRIRHNLDPNDGQAVTTGH
jgi:hypothetical protein